MKTVKALFIDPKLRMVYDIELLLTPPPDETCGPQVSHRQLSDLLGRVGIDGFYLPGGKDLAYIDEEGLYHTKHFFQLGPNCDPVPGKCIIVGHDIRTDSYRDVTVTREEVERTIIWTKRVLRGERVVDIPGGIRIEADLPIVDE